MFFSKIEKNSDGNFILLVLGNKKGNSFLNSPFPVVEYLVY